MYRKLILLVFTALIAVSCSGDDLPSQDPVQDLVEQHVEFHVFTDRDFSSSQFDDAYVKTHMAITKVDPEGENVTLFEKTYDWTHFREFPTSAAKIIEAHDLTYDQKTEHINISYGQEFRFNGQISANAVFYSLPDGETSHMVEIDL